MVLSFSEAAAQAVQGAACSLLALSDEGTRWINSAIGADGDFGNIAGALRKNVCNVSNPDTTDYGPDIPFTGGQCDCHRYEIRVQGIDTSGNPIQSPFARVRGPISGIRIFLGSVLVECRGFTLNITGSNYPNCGPVQEGAIVQGPSTFASITGVVFTESPDGDPNDCGNPEGEPIGDYNDYSETTSITYEDNSETEITEDIDITLGPLIVGIGGILYAPVTVGVGDINLDGRVVIAPEFRVDLFPEGLFGGGGSSEGPIPDPSEPDPEPDPEEGRDRIIGVVVTTTALDQELYQGTQVAQCMTPDLFLPRLCNVSFFVDTSEGPAWTPPIAVQNVRAYIPCPAREGAIDVAITAETGVTADIKRIFAELPSI
jgi:hypothetical protein